MAGKNAILFVVILGIIGIVAAQQSGFKLSFIPQLIAGSCQNIFSNNYHFLGCAENPGQTQAFASKIFYDSFGLKNYGPVQCPTTAGRCTAQSPKTMAVFSSCTFDAKGYIFLFPTWTCTGKIGENVDAKAGQWIFFRDGFSFGSDGISNVVFFITAYQMYLYDCGSSQCASSTSGTPLLNTLGCKIVTDKSIYDSNGNLIKTGIAGQNFEYVVPFYGNVLYTTDALRQITGQACNECTADADCAIGRQFQYTYFDGKVYGADATTANQLNLYACKTSSQVCVDGTNFPGVISDTCKTSTNLNKCIAFATVPVSCIPGSATCGPNAVCNSKTFTCSTPSTVECTSDFNCGNAGVVCDFSTKTLKQNGCFNNKCGSKVIQNVEACISSQCPSGYFVDTDYKCKQGIPQQTLCPYECCQNDPRYFDKGCTSGAFCSNNICSSTPPPPIEDKNLAMVLAGIAALLVFLISGRTALKEGETIDIMISAVIALIVFFVVWWVLSNLLLFLAGSALITLLGGALIYFFGGVFIIIAAIIGMIIKNLKGE